MRAAGRPIGWRILRRITALVALLSIGWAALAEPPDRRTASWKVAVTIDDLPWAHGAYPGGPEAGTRALIAHLVAREVPAVGFVNCGRLDATGERVLAQWRGAGLALGNHQQDHDSLNHVAPQAWLAGVRACSAHLAASAPTVRWFRYPYLFNGPSLEIRDPVRAELTGPLGLEVARVTIDNRDWRLAQLYAEAAGDAATRQALATHYVNHVAAAAAHYRSLARDKLGRDVAHVLLLHANGLNADHLGTLLDRLRADGAEFVSLAQAQADPVYARPDAYVGRAGISWLYRVAPVTTDWPFDTASWDAIEARFSAPSP